MVNLFVALVCNSIKLKLNCINYKYFQRKQSDKFSRQPKQTAMKKEEILRIRSRTGPSSHIHIS